MENIDVLVLQFFNQFSHRWQFFDLFVSHLFWDNLLKGAVIIALLWWGWFKEERNNPVTFERVIVAFVSCVLSVAAARGVALTYYRVRPLHVKELAFKVPLGLRTDTLENWSSFPSDHAALYFALAMGLFLISRRLGVFALIYAFVAICLPRIYAGVHYPSDILAGAAVGVGMTWVLNFPQIRRRIANPAIEWRRASAGSFYAAMFLLSYEIADLFEHSRALLSAAAKAAHLK